MDDPQDAPTPDRPNLLVLLPDQLRRQAITGPHRDPVHTPHLDRLAAQGRSFTRACSSLPVCSAARAMLWTGRRPFSTGVVSNCNSAHTRLGIYLKTSERCLSDVLSDAGYAVGYVGKWHLEGPREPFVEAPLPFDGNVWDAYTPPGPARHGHAFWYAYGVFNDHRAPHYWTGEAPWDERVEVRAWSPEHEADVAIGFLRANRDRPFALTVAMNPPHPPHDQVPAEALEPYRDRAPEELLTRPNVDLESAPASGPGAQARRAVRGYFGAITGVDAQIGRILACLDEEGLAERTIVVFSSDHGEMLGSHGRMQKGFVHQEAVGVPLVVRWPGRVPQGTTCDALLDQPDLMPSLLGLMGLADRIPAAVEGVDRSGALSGADDAGADGLVYVNVGAGLRRLRELATARDGDLGALLASPERPEHLVAALAAHPHGERALITRRHTYLVRRTEAGVERRLFDDERDPFQLEDRLPRAPGLAAELEERLRAELALRGDPWDAAGYA